MVLSEKNISDFQEIYRQEFGEEMSKEEASKHGAKLVRLMQILYTEKKGVVIL